MAQQETVTDVIIKICIIGFIVGFIIKILLF